MVKKVWSAAHIQRGLVVRRPDIGTDATIFQASNDNADDIDEFYMVAESTCLVLPGGPKNAAQMALYLTEHGFTIRGR